MQDLGLLQLMWVDRKPFPFVPTVLFPPEVALLITDLPGGGRTDQGRKSSGAPLIKGLVIQQIFTKYLLYVRLCRLTWWRDIKTVPGLQELRGVWMRHERVTTFHGLVNSHKGTNTFLGITGKALILPWRGWGSLLEITAKLCGRCCFQPRA